MIRRQAGAQQRKRMMNGGKVGRDLSGRFGGFGDLRFFVGKTPFTASG